MTKRILIIGGAGFIGINTAEYYLQRGDEVTIFDNLSRAGSIANLLWLKGRFWQFKFTQGDIRTDLDKLRRVVVNKDIIFHFAAQTAVTNSVTNPREDFQTNALGTFNVLETARQYNPTAIIVYASTNKVYGELTDSIVTERNGRYEYENLKEGVSETVPLDFHSPYGCSKGAGDQYVRDYARIYGLRTIVFRQSCIYGPNQFGIEDQGWVAWFIIGSLLHRPLTIYGDGKQVRDILFIEDLVRAYDLAVAGIGKTAGKIYNIGGGPSRTLSLLELLEKLNFLSGGRVECLYDNWRPGDQKVYVSNISKAREDFGWEPQVEVPVGIEKLYKWAGNNIEIISDYL